MTRNKLMPIIAALAAFALPLSCDLFFGPSLRDKRHQDVAGDRAATVRLSISSAITNTARTFHPDPEDIQPADLVIHGDGPGSATVDDIILVSAATWESPPLDAGSWTFTITARNSAGIDIGAGQTTVNVSSGQVSATVQIRPFTGEGELSISVTWPVTAPAYPLDPRLVARLEPRGSTTGSAIDLNDTEFDYLVAGSATILSLLDVTSGSYFLTLSLYEGDPADGQLAWSRGDSVLIFRDMQTIVSHNAPALNTAPTVSITAPEGAVLPGAETTIETGAIGATIRYTTDGSAPTASHGTLYTPGDYIQLRNAGGTMLVSELRVIAYNRFGSSTASATYVAAINDCIYVSTSTGLDTNSGIDTAPKATIRAALELVEGQHLAAAEIRIAAGDYTEIGGLDLFGGVTLYGGYDPGDWAAPRAPATNQTHVLYGGAEVGTVADPVATIRVPADCDATVVIDGLFVEGPAGVRDYSTAILVDSTEETRVVACDVRGGTGTSQAFGIFARTASRPVIISNPAIHGGSSNASAAGIVLSDTVAGTVVDLNTDINGGGSAILGSFSSGVRVTLGASATISNSTITGGVGSDSRGIDIDNAGNVLVTGCSVDGGGDLGVSTASYGIRVYSSLVEILNNPSITAGVGNNSYGIYADAVTGGLSIRDNPLIAGGGRPGSSATYGIMFTSSSIGTVQNNSLIRGGTLSSISCGIRVYSGSNATITENVTIDGQGGAATTESWGIRVDSAFALITLNDTILGGTPSGASSSASAVSLDDSLAGTLIDNNGIIDGGGAGTTYTHGVQMGNNAVAAIDTNMILGGTGTTTSVGVHANGALPTVLQNDIRGGSGGTAEGIRLLYNADAPQISDNIITGRTGAVGATYGVRVIGSDPVLDGTNIITSGDSGGVFEAVGLFIDGSNPMYPADPSIGDASNDLSISAGGSTSTGLSVGIMINGVGATGTYRRLNVTGRVAGSGEARGIDINGASPQILSPGIIRSGSTNGAAAAGFGIRVDGTGADPANPIIGDLADDIVVQSGGPGMTSTAYGIYIIGPNASGTYTRLNVTGRTGGSNDADGINIQLNARPFIESSRILSGDSSGTGTLCGIRAQNIAAPGFIVEDSVISGGVSTGTSNGVYLSNVDAARIRRNRIYGGDAPAGLGNAGVTLISGASNMNEVFLISNAIFGSGISNNNHSLRIIADTAVISSARIYNNTIYAAGNNTAVHTESPAPGGRSATIFRGNIIHSDGGYGLYESSSGGGIFDPGELSNNSFSGGIGAYWDSVSFSLTEGQINNASQSLQSGGTSQNNNVITAAGVFIGGAFPANRATFETYDWRLLAVANLAFRQGGYNMNGDPMLTAEDRRDLYGNPRTDPYSIGAAEF